MNTDTETPPDVKEAKELLLSMCRLGAASIEHLTTTDGSLTKLIEDRQSDSDRKFELLGEHLSRNAQGNFPALITECLKTAIKNRQSKIRDVILSDPWMIRYELPTPQDSQLSASADQPSLAAIPDEQRSVLSYAIEKNDFTLAYLL